MGQKNRKPVAGMWLMWLAILLILAGMVQDFLWIFFDGYLLMYTGAVCTATGIICLVIVGKNTVGKRGRTSPRHDLSRNNLQ